MVILSKRVMNILDGMVKRIEIYSIDEAFLDLATYTKYKIKHMNLVFIVAILYGNGLEYLCALELRQLKLLPRLQVILQKIQMVAQGSAA